MGLFKEAFITLRAVVVSILNVVSFFVVEEINFLKELFGADLEETVGSLNGNKRRFKTHFTTKLWLFQMHLSVGEEST
jgi:hypothetical protein